MSADRITFKIFGFTIPSLENLHQVEIGGKGGSAVVDSNQTYRQSAVCNESRDKCPRCLAREVCESGVVKS